MVEFSDNNNLSVSTNIISFYFNKDFHSRISFSPHSTSYESTRERLQVRTAEDIANRMKKLLEYGRNRFAIAQDAIKDQADRYRTDIIFDIEDKVYISSRDIKTIRLSRSLENK